MKDLKVEIAKITEFDKFYDFFESSLYKDFPDIRSDLKDFYVSEGYPREALRELVIKGKRTVFLAKLNKKIIGYVLVHQDWGGINIALWLAVHESYRGKGVGKALLNTWETNSRKNKNHALLLYTTTNENRNFYKHMGFSEAGYLPNFWFNIGYFVFFKHI